MFYRLRSARFSVIIVSSQFRMRPGLLKLPSNFTYEGKMIYDPSIQSITLNPIISQTLLESLKLKANGSKVG